MFQATTPPDPPNSPSTLWMIVERFKNWILFDNQLTVHLFSNPSLFLNIYPVAEPVDMHSSGGTTHYDAGGDLPNFGGVFLFKYGLTKILSFFLICDKYNM